jgi:cytochrome c oxidase subunit 2
MAEGLCAIARLERLYDRTIAVETGVPVRTAAVVFVTSAVAGCDGPQSALMPAGVDAARIAGLFWWMVGGALFIWLAVIGLAIYATRTRRAVHDRDLSWWLIVGGGVVFPTVVLAVLLAYGLYLLEPPTVRPTTLRLEVAGAQWWWRVRYLTAGGEAVELANEVRLPVGERVEIRLTSADVIHAFWIPPLGGKIDMIPGRANRLVLEPTRTGTFRGVCAEYCGTSHALMAFPVVVMEKQAFAAWLAHQAAPAQPPADPLGERGQAQFLANGCGGCHRVRGTPAQGRIGPDLTHVGSRLTLGAGILPNHPDAYLRWIRHTDAVKPGVRMPAFGMLPAEAAAAIAAYLNGLE